MFLKRILFTVIISSLIGSLSAQTYRPIDTIVSGKEEIKRYFNQNTKKIEEEFKSSPTRNNRLIRGFIKDRNELIDELVVDNYLIVDDELNEYLNKLLQNIIQQNGLSDSHLKIFLTRDISPNAYSLGDGSFVFNLSLLNRLENEEELYSIIGHEVGHYLLDHLGVEFKERMKLAQSKNFKIKERKIRRSKYNKYSKHIEHYKEFQYGNRTKRRQRELEADSIGFVLIKNIVKNPNNAITALQKADSISPSEITKIDLNKLKDHFSTDTMPFEERWTSGYDFSKYNYQKGKVNIFGVHKDSISTHPETQERVDRLKKLIQNEEIKPQDKSDEFTQLKEKIRLEDVYAHYCLEEYGKGIYLILQLQSLDDNSQRESAFYSHMLSLFYKNLSEARRSMEFKKYVDDIDPNNMSEEYTLLLTILDNLNSSELEEVAKKYQIN